jgi:uncharacterized LabA/DUF88 family protein
MNLEQRIIIFIDGNNLYHGLKTVLGNAKIDFAKFINKLSVGRRLLRTYYYNAPVSQSENPERAKSQQKFFSALYNVPYLEVKLGRLEPRGNTYVEKGVDINIAVDMLNMAYKNLYDVCILVSGDSDFHPAIQAVKDLGKHVEVAYTSTTFKLKQIADNYILITNSFLSDCL